MALKLYNTLTRKKQTFKPIKEGEIGIYSCGPTVNDIPHLGHAKQQISFDVLRKYLEFLGYKVKFVSNVTDIEDKIITKANQLGIPIDELTKRNYKLHMEDYEKLNIKKPTVQPKATDYICEMIDLVNKLLKKGFAYIIDEDGVYFDSSKFKKYGQLSRQKLDALQIGKRVLNENKKNPNDFVLWKFSKPNEPKWSSPWGKGRPGWHIECSAMSSKILGLPFDIHCGGQDLIFPHHEDEIAQSEAGYGKKFVNFWVHNGMVNVNGEKMSKSLNNFKTIRDLFESFNPMVIRYFVLSGHYRKSIDFNKESLEDAKNSYERLKKNVLEIENDKKENREYLKKFTASMDDDLNTPQALAVLWELVRDKNAAGKYETIKKINEVLGLKLFEQEKISIPIEIKEIADKRQKARQEKNWKLSDELREKLNKHGWNIKDAKDNYELEKI